jgi:hypothetical protein
VRHPEPNQRVKVKREILEKLIFYIFNFVGIMKKLRSNVSLCLDLESTQRWWRTIGQWLRILWSTTNKPEKHKKKYLVGLFARLGGDEMSDEHVLANPEER